MAYQGHCCGLREARSKPGRQSRTMSGGSSLCQLTESGALISRSVSASPPARAAKLSS
jgi:hypothetical protein